MNELISINYDTENLQYQQESYTNLLKSASDFRHGLRQILKDLLRTKITPAYLQVRRFRTTVAYRSENYRTIPYR